MAKKNSKSKMKKSSKRSKKKCLRDGGKVAKKRPILNAADKKIGDRFQLLNTKEEIIARLRGAGVRETVIKEMYFQAKERERMGRESPELIEKCIKDLDSKDWAIREKAAFELGMAGKKASSAVPKLIDRLDDNDQKVRDAVIKALGRIGDKAAVPALLNKLPKDAVDQTLNHLIPNAISEIGESAVPILTGLLKDKNETVRWYAAHMLRKFEKKASS